ALALCLVPSAFGSEDKKPADQPEKRVAVAKCAAETGLLVRRESPDKPWHFVANKEELFSGDLLVGGASPVVNSRNGAVSLILQGDLDGPSPFPIIETAVVLHETTDADLDFTMERGRVVIRNLKEKGSARVRVRLGNRSGEFTLTEPGA